MPFERCRLNDPLVGGMTWSQDMGKRILSCTGYEFEGPLAASMTFYAAGRMFRTDWFRFHVEVNRGNILRLDPVNMAARRVQVLEPHNEDGRVRSELVVDVTEPVADETPAEA